MNQRSLSEAEARKKRCEEENLAAQRATAEAIAISRATLETTLCQGEQLEHCDALRERHQYIVDKSARIVKGMTWSGWFSNVFTKDVEPPPDKKSHTSVKEQICFRNVSQVLEEDDIYTNLPEEIGETAMIVKNLECNVILLEQCQSRDEFDGLLEICTQLNISAKQSIESFHTTTSSGGSGGERSQRSMQLLRKLRRKVDEIEEERNRIVKQCRTKFHTETSSSKATKNNRLAPTQMSMSSPSTRIWSKTSDTNLQTRIEQQDAHLDAIASGLQELLHNGSSIGESIQQQNELLERLNDGTDELTEKSKMVSRRADRVAHRSLWRKPKPEFKYSIAIQHVESKRFLTIEPQNKKRLALHEQFHPDTAAFELHKRTAEGSVLVGLKNKCTRTWLGQSTMGFIVCNSNKFGPKEEWELDNEGGVNTDMRNMSRTRMLCASANWGNGGWLTVRVDEKTESFSVGDYDAAGKKKASIWSIVVLDETNS